MSQDHTHGPQASDGRADTATGPSHAPYPGAPHPGAASHGPQPGYPPYHDPWHLGPQGAPYGAPFGGAPVQGYGPAPGYYGPWPQGGAAMPYGPAGGPAGGPAMAWPGYGPWGAPAPGWNGGPHGDGSTQGAPTGGTPSGHWPSAFNWTSGWLDIRNEAYLKGLLVGALGAVLLSNDDVQKKAMQSVAGLWGLLQGGVEEIKERFADVEAEMSAASRQSTPDADVASGPSRDS